MRRLRALVFYVALIWSGLLADEVTGAEDTRSFFGAIPVQAMLRAGVSHLEQDRFPGAWGLVEFVVVTSEGTEFQYVYSRDKKRIRGIQQAGQVQYSINLEETPIAWSAEKPDFLRHLEMVGVLPAGKLKEIVKDIPGGSWRWHQLKVLSYKDGIGRVLDDDGNEKSVSLVSRRGNLEREKYDGSFGEKKRIQFEAFLKAGKPLYVFTADRVGEFAAENILLIDTESIRTEQ